MAAAAATGFVWWYLPTMLAIGVSLLIAWIGWVDLRLHALRVHPSSIIALRCEAAGLAYQLKQGAWIKGQPQTGGLVHPWLTVVRFRDASRPHKIRTLVLLPDALTTENFRRLRVHLVWRHAKNKASRVDEMA